MKNKDDEDKAENRTPQQGIRVYGPFAVSSADMLLLVAEQHMTMAEQFKEALRHYFPTDADDGVQGVFDKARYIDDRLQKKAFGCIACRSAKQGVIALQSDAELFQQMLGKTPAEMADIRGTMCYEIYRLMTERGCEEDPAEYARKAIEAYGSAAALGVATKKAAQRISELEEKLRQN
jgi:hypothetical protein